MAVAGRDRLEPDRLERADGRKLRLRDAHPVVFDHAAGPDDEGVAEQRRAAELFHERRGKLLERVAEEDHLRLGAEGVEERLRPRQGVDAGDRLPDAREAEPAFAQDAEAEPHELAVVRLVARRAPQFRHAHGVGERDPDFGDEDAFDVETHDVHGWECSGCLVFRAGFRTNGCAR